MMSFEESLALKIAQDMRTVSQANVAATQRQGPAFMPVIQPVTAEMPPDGSSFEFEPQTSVVLPAVGASVTVVSFKVPPGQNGIVTGFANQFIGGGFQDGSGNLIWSIQADGVAVKGYLNILGTRGTFAVPADLKKNPIRIFEGQTISLVLKNVAIGPAGQFLIGLFTGFFFPINDESSTAWM